MTKVTFETAALADSMRKAEVVAPSSGIAFDKAAGIMMEVAPADGQVILRATNLDIYYMEWLTPLEIEGNPVSWLVPSKVTSAFISALPIGTGRTVTLEQTGNALQFSSGRSKGQFRLISGEYFPEWYAFEEENMTTVENLGARVRMVEWAAARDSVAMGLRFQDGNVMATDRYRLATAPCEIPGFGEGVTIPPATLSNVIKKEGDTKLRVEDNFLLVMPDEYTQIKIVRVGEQYPPVARIQRRDYPESVSFNKSGLIELVNRSSKIAADRFPALELIIGKEELAVFVSENERGFIGDVMETPGEAAHPRVKIKCSPGNLLDALNACPNGRVKLSYDPDNAKKALLYLDGGSGYECWLAPRGDVPKPSSDDKDKA